MEQMQNVMLNMLQAMTTSKNEAPQSAKTDSAQENEFRKLMEEHRTPEAEKEAAPQKTESKPTEKAEPEGKEELDQTSLQELAAMQMFCMGTTQNIVTPEGQMASEVVTEGLAAVETVVVPEGQQEQAAVMLMDDQQNVGVESFKQEMGEAQTQLDKPVEAVQQTPEAQVSTQQEQMPEMSGVENAGQQSGGEREEQFDVQTGGETQVFEHVEAAPIKVSETARPTETAQVEETVETQIVEKVTQAVSNGETKVELQLNPEHLGKLTIEVTQKADGTVHIAVHAENSQTRGLLERDAMGLQNLLGRATQQEVHVEVYQPQESERDGFYEDQQHHQQQEKRERQERRKGEPVDFLNQLRLGLVAQAE